MIAAVAKLVLVAEDDDSMREAIERLLNAAGFQCEAHASAEALLASGSGRAAACVVSDLKLPGKSGLELLAEIRSRGGWPPLILITAFDVPGQREEAQRRGAVAYLIKPFSGTALLAAVRAVVEPARTS